MKYLITIIFFALFTIEPIIAQNTNSTKIENQQILTDTVRTSAINNPPTDDDFAPGLIFLVLIAIAVILICIGVGIAITVITLFVIFGLIGVGIVSASVLVGLNKRSLALGLKTFIVSLSTVGELILSSLLFWILNEFQQWWTYQTALAIGAGIGILAGLVLGFLLFYILHRLTTFLRNQFNLKAAK